MIRYRVHRSILLRKKEKRKSEKNQGCRSHRIIGGDIKEDWEPGGRSPLEAEAFL